MTDNTLICFVCGKNLDPAFADVEECANQPYYATTFIAYGQYGSTVFDNMGSDYLEINICDEHLLEHQSRILHVIPTKSITRETRPWDAK